MTKEEILIKHCATDGQFCDENEIDCFTHQATEAMEEYAKQQSVGFFKWYAEKMIGFCEYLQNIKPRVTSNEIEEKLLEFEGKTFEQLYNLYLQRV